MYKIVSTKRYTIHHKKGKFTVAVSEHDDGSFHGTVVDYEVSGSRGTRPQWTSVTRSFTRRPKRTLINSGVNGWIKPTAPATP